jgi:hypothetical protein
MSYNTTQGKAYTLDDVERLANIESFGHLSGAVKGLVQRARFLEKERKDGMLLIESLQSQFLALKAEVNSLKK